MIVRTLIFPTVLYGCETWTVTKKMGKKINACVMWIWRKMQRISWADKKTNESVRMEIRTEEDETLKQSANSAKKKARILWTCYAIRWTGKKNDAGTRRWKEEKRTTKEKWMDEIHEVTGMKLAELRDVTAERKHRRRMVKTVAITRRVDITR